MSHRVEGLQLTDSEQEYLLPHFLMLVVGKPGSGKSYSVQQLATSPKFYGRKFDVTVIVSPSAQKLGIPVKKENQSTIYSLPWIFERITKANQYQIQRMEGMLKTNQPNKLLRAIPQSVVTASLSKDVKEKGPSKLPPEYIAFNKNQRFFNIETLALLKQGYTALSKLQDDMNHKQQEQIQPVQVSRRKTKIQTKEQGKTVLSKSVYGQYKDVDEIEREVVSKLSPEQQRLTSYNMLIIMDDVIGDIKSFENETMQQQLFFNRRHLIANGTISVIIVSQKYTMCPARIRSNCSWLLLFRLNPVDFDNVYKDVIMLTNEKWQKLITDVYGTDKDAAIEDKKSKRYDNLGIWVEYDIFFKDFKKIKVN